MTKLWRMMVLALPAAALAQQPGSAGARRPKLEVLKALPEAQLFPLMNLVATSLGVRCDYCHVQATPDLSRTPSNADGWVWDSDDKAPKRRARQMMKMVVALNASQFNGDSRVTCFTCHRGATQPSRLPSLPPSGTSAAHTPAPTPLPSADRVVAAYLAAVGGDATARAAAMSLHGWDERSEGRNTRFEVTVAGTDRYRITVNNPTGVVTQGLDAEGAWSSTNGQTQRLTSPADVTRMRRIAMRYRPLKGPPANPRVVGIESVDGRDAFVLEARLDSVTTQRSYYEVVTGLLRREITTTETLLIPLVEQVDYDDYRDVGGMQLPFRISASTGAPYDTSVRTIMEVKRNVPASDSTFRPPPG